VAKKFNYVMNVAWLKWSEWKDCSYGGSITALLNAIGREETAENMIAKIIV
jgi:hypothetical protein